MRLESERVQARSAAVNEGGQGLPCRERGWIHTSLSWPGHLHPGSSLTQGHSSLDLHNTRLPDVLFQFSDEILGRVKRPLLFLSVLSSFS